MRSIAVPVADLVARAFVQSDIGLVPNHTALVGDHFTIGMLFGCAVVSSSSFFAPLGPFNGPGALAPLGPNFLAPLGPNFLAPLGLHGLHGLNGLFFSPAFLTEVFCAPHDQGSMCPYAFQAREGLHRIIVPEVLFGMVRIAGADHTDFQRLICKLETTETAEAIDTTVGLTGAVDTTVAVDTVEALVQDTIGLW
jgi:hypothetical protein